jgi:hypothetical protein
MGAAVVLPTRVWRSCTSAGAVASSTRLHSWNQPALPTPTGGSSGQMMARQTPHPAFNAAAAIANPSGLAMVPCEAINQRKQNLVNTGHAARPDNSRIRCRRIHRESGAQ